MTTLATADGRLLKRTGPSGQGGLVGGGFFPPMWSNGETWGPNGAPDVNGRTISYGEVYETQPAVASVVNKLVRQASRLPLKVYERGPDNARKRLHDHPLEALLRRPRERCGPVKLKQWAFMPLLIHGNALIGKWREDPEGPPTEFIPLDWRYVDAYAPQGGPVEVWITNQTGQQRWEPVEETIHFAWDSPNGELGVSPLKQLGTMVRMEDAAQRHQTASFANGVRPSGAITVPPDTRMTDPEVRKFYREQVEALHKGVDQAGKMAILSPGADIKPLSFSAADAQLIEQRLINREEAQMVYDMAPPLVGDYRRGTYTNVADANKQLFKSVLPPWLTLVEETIQAQLIDPEPEWTGLFCEFDLGEALKGDPKELAEAITLEINSGTLTPNEGRKLQNRPRDPDPAADKLYLPVNNLQPLGTPPQSEAPPLEAPEPPPDLP